MIQAQRRLISAVSGSTALRSERPLPPNLRTGSHGVATEAVDEFAGIMAAHHLVAGRGTFTPPCLPQRHASTTMRIRHLTSSGAPPRRAEPSAPLKQESRVPPKPRHCSQCGTPVTTQLVEDRERLVCPDCHTIFYDNPVPVAAAVVLNERRHVLLVKRNRDPHKGRWCLPMGFAESGETIAEAAVRELKEETGTDGRVLRLLDATSLPSGDFGDVVIVTFELRKTGGSEHPGDDADEVRYFPLSQYPPLPFSANEQALRICAQTHLEGWAIQDSFVTLQGDEDKVMLSDALVALVEERSQEIITGWIEEVLSSPTTRSYHELGADQLARQAATAVSQFGRWLQGHEVADDLKQFYRSVGHQRRTEGFNLHEIFSALTLLKKHVWSFARTQNIPQRPIDVYSLLEFGRRVALFFDQATYQAARGFEAEHPVGSGPPRPRP